MADFSQDWKKKPKKASGSAHTRWRRTLHTRTPHTHTHAHTHVRSKDFSTDKDAI